MRRRPVGHHLEVARRLKQKWPATSVALMTGYGDRMGPDDALAKAGVQNIMINDADMTKLKKIHWDVGQQNFLIKPSPKYGPGLVDIVKKFAPK